MYVRSIINIARDACVSGVVSRIHKSPCSRMEGTHCGGRYAQVTKLIPHLKLSARVHFPQDYYYKSSRENSRARAVAAVIMAQGTGFVCPVTIVAGNYRHVEGARQSNRCALHSSSIIRDGKY